MRAYYLAQAGATIVGIIDKNGGVINNNGFSFNEIKSLINSRNSNSLETSKMLSKHEINEKIWSIGADILFLS